MRAGSPLLPILLGIGLAACAADSPMPKATIAPPPGMLRILYSCDSGATVAAVYDNSDAAVPRARLTIDDIPDGSVGRNALQQALAAVRVTRRFGVGGRGMWLTLDIPYLRPAGRAARQRICVRRRRAALFQSAGQPHEDR